jgi:hypothetical protein
MALNGFTIGDVVMGLRLVARDLYWLAIHCFGIEQLTTWNTCVIGSESKHKRETLYKLAGHTSAALADVKPSDLMEPTSAAIANAIVRLPTIYLDP